LATSTFVLTSVVPSILLSLPGGVLGDALPNKFTLSWTLSIRTAIAWAFFEYNPGLAAVLALTTLNWAVYQFYTPGENAAVPAVVPSSKFAQATAALHAVSLLAQLFGAGLLAPLALKVLGERGLFAIVLLFLLAALSLFISIPRLSVVNPGHSARVNWVRALPVGLRTVVGNDLLLRATVLRVVLDTSFMMLVVAAPLLVTQVLGIAPENTVYIVAPGALGVAAGLVIAPILVRVATLNVTLWIGFTLVVFTVFLLASIPEVARLLDEEMWLPLRQLQQTFGVKREIASTMLVLPLGGIGVSLVQVASRAAVYEVAPLQTVAQVFATQSAIGSVAAFLPTILAGALLDMLNVRTVIGAIGVFMLLASPAAAFAPSITKRKGQGTGPH
jgi:hypothetical protein